MSLAPKITPKPQVEFEPGETVIHKLECYKPNRKRFMVLEVNDQKITCRSEDFEVFEFMEFELTHV